MKTPNPRRFKTGEECSQMGKYRFDGYTDGTSTPAPTAEEREIYFMKEHIFPPIPSQRKKCWWKLT